MRSAPKLALFALLLLAVFGTAAALGGAVGSDPVEPRETAAHGGGHEAPAAAPAATAGSTLPGLAVTQDGLRLALERTTQPRTATAPIRLRILDRDGTPRTRFDANHEKRLHLIVVRRDARFFQHLHPEMAPDGTWSVDADLSRAGTYRVFADVTVDGRQTTLGADVQVPGAYEPKAVPPPATTVRDDRGLEVRLRRDGDRFAFSVLRDGVAVDDQLQPYLGAKGHLVTLRLGDLAYLHTHPEGDRLAFAAELPSPGTYRLWVQFRLDGRLHTAAFTQEVPS